MNPQGPWWITNPHHALYISMGNPSTNLFLRHLCIVWSPPKKWVPPRDPPNDMLRCSPPAIRRFDLPLVHLDRGESWESLCYKVGRGGADFLLPSNRVGYFTPAKPMEISGHLQYKGPISPHWNNDGRDPSCRVWVDRSTHTLSTFRSISLLCGAWNQLMSRTLRISPCSTVTHWVKGAFFSIQYALNVFMCCLMHHFTTKTIQCYFGK